MRSSILMRCAFQSQTLRRKALSSRSSLLTCAKSRDQRMEGANKTARRTLTTFRKVVKLTHKTVYRVGETKIKTNSREARHFCELCKRSTFTSVSILVLFVSTFILLLRYVFWVFVLCQKYHLNLTSWGQLRQTGNLESLSKHEVTNTEPVESEANPFFVHNLRQSEHKVTPRDTEYEMRGKNGTNGITDTNTEATSGRGSVSSQVSNDSCVSTTSVCTNNFARGWSTSSSSYSNGFKSVKAPQDWFLIL